MEISRSPYNINAKVLGIGVAVITNTSGFSPLLFSVLLCLTPNLCCSSVTTSPKFLNMTFSSSKLCVPINTSISPFDNLFKISSFCFLEMPLTNNSHLILKFERISSKFFKCCLLKIAVGAITAT